MLLEKFVTKPFGVGFEHAWAVSFEHLETNPDCLIGGGKEEFISATVGGKEEFVSSTVHLGLKPAWKQERELGGQTGEQDARVAAGA